MLPEFGLMTWARGACWQPIPAHQEVVAVLQKARVPSALSTVGKAASESPRCSVQLYFISMSYRVEKLIRLPARSTSLIHLEG